ncbi:MAG TPA: DUF4038 domain-containing protein [Victivallales bacterium]|nr:DUF4038 domain-containing protein [Victivallales bacterium]HPO89647.1 DUF4038 domain-containing protein [Victivallales bacterium]HRR05869.1 DUF4038 domain-containing protein [Victivallales bacterium]HRR27789.1 DUF4038 domain-containing protein [Victivallales bacterium]HRU01095.1 DUF4038 domain-containing protein [Victivallales bacterium]
MKKEVKLNCIFEVGFHSEREYQNPPFENELIAEFYSPSGKILKIRGFWDGKRKWKLRFSPDEIGQWEWKTFPVNLDNGLIKSGSFICNQYTGKNPVYKNGSLKISKNGFYISYQSEEPFFWLGDTAWNGVIRGDDNNWQKYLRIRRKQKFNVIQFVACHWRGDSEDEFGEKACDDEVSPIKINPRFFQRIDKRIFMINKSGLYAAPVILWTLLETDIGQKLSEEDAILLAKYIVARYDACQCVWLLGGDGDYQKIGIERWKRIGREVFKFSHKRLATLHPCGQNWVGEEFRSEDWYSFIGYQSGHGDSDEHISWLVKGPPSLMWKHQIQKPVINLEPNYENAIAYHHRTRFNAYHVRRAAYWSLFVSPPAGITYGHDSIWNWNFETGPSEGHGNWGDRLIEPWYIGLETEGISSMTLMKKIIEKFKWHTFKPFNAILMEQPGDTDPKKFIAIVKSEDNIVLAYLPCGGELKLKPDIKVTEVYLINPENGKKTKVKQGNNNLIKTYQEKDCLVTFKMA